MKQTLKYLLKWLAKGLAIFFLIITVLTIPLILHDIYVNIHNYLMIKDFWFFFWFFENEKTQWIKIIIEYIRWIISGLGNWNYLIAFVSACIESLPFIGTTLPWMQVMIFVWWFWTKEHFFLTILLAITWAMLGNYIGYWIWKWYGWKILEKYGIWFGLWKTEMNILSDQIKRNGFWYIVLGKFHNFTRAFVPFIAGSSWMSEKSFWLYNMIWSIIWAFSINLLGIYFIGKYDIILKNLWKITFILLLAICVYIYFFKRKAFSEYMKNKEQEIEEKIAEKERRKSSKKI